VVTGFFSSLHDINAVRAKKIKEDLRNILKPGMLNCYERYMLFWDCPRRRVNLSLKRIEK
jgi:hypothetical protein